MTSSKQLLAGGAGALALGLVAQTALAADAGAYVCEAWNPTKASSTVTHCITWSREAARRLRAAACDPLTKDDAAMRERCAELTAEAGRNSAKPPAAG